MTLSTSLSIMRAEPNPDRLDTRRIAGLVAMGTFFWLVGVGVIRMIEPLDVLTSPWIIPFFLAVLAATIPIVILTPRLLGLPQRQAMACVTIMVATAALIDAVVIRWCGWIYASDPRQLSVAAASLLWGLGIAAAAGVFVTNLSENRLRLPLGE